MEQDMAHSPAKEKVRMGRREQINSPNKPGPRQLRLASPLLPVAWPKHHNADMPILPVTVLFTLYEPSLR